MERITCKNCEGKIEIDITNNGEKMPCPACGNTARQYELCIEEQVIVRSGLKMKAKHDFSRPHFESRDIPDLNRDRQKIVRRKQIFDRENDLYIEEITDYDTGEVIHHCEEPLSNHKNRGAAKKG